MRATTGSSEAWFLVPFMLIWSGFAFGGIYGSQWQKGKFDLLESLFGIPFVIASFLFGSRAIMTAGGHVVVRRSGNEGSIFQGVGPFGWTQRFRWSDVESVTEAEASHGPRHGPNYRLIRFTLNSDMRRTLKCGPFYRRSVADSLFQFSSLRLWR